MGTPMDMLHMLDTPMLLDMLVPMVLTLMPELMVATTLARGLLKLSLKLMLMPTMVPMDTLHMALLLMHILDTVDILDTVHMLDTHTLMGPTLPMVLMPVTDKKDTSIICSMKNHNFTQKLSIYRKSQQHKNQYDRH